MPEFLKAVSYVLSNEATLLEDASTGEVSKYGISLKWLKGIDPEATAATIRNLTKPAAIDLYRVHFWDKNHLGWIPSQRVATKLLDMMVNFGEITGIRMLQCVLNEPVEDGDEHLDIDG